MSGINIIPMADEHHDGIVAAAEALPEWFDEAGRRSIAVDAPFLKGLVALDADGRVVGFLLYYVCEAVGHIAWLGALPEMHGQGIGRALVTRLDDALRAGGVDMVEVQTLGDSVDYEPYERTRAFYYAMGFTEHRRELTDNPGCPERLYLRKPVKQAGAIPDRKDS